ncbi:hypothetical protein Pelo_15269 [Pelomyxa schiedti]|nr:hypothetical protein Pelo_15269 [Pelomyxa schiedti]
MRLSDTLTVRYFHLPIQTVANELGICATMLKKFCRKHGIKRWPHRKIQSLNNAIHELESALSKPDISDEMRQIRSEELAVVLAKKRMIMEDPNAEVTIGHRGVFLSQSSTPCSSPDNCPECNLSLPVKKKHRNKHNAACSIPVASHLDFNCYAAALDLKEATPLVEYLHDSKLGEFKQRGGIGVTLFFPGLPNFDAALCEQQQPPPPSQQQPANPTPGISNPLEALGPQPVIEIPQSGFLSRCPSIDPIPLTASPALGEMDSLDLITTSTQPQPQQSQLELSPSFPPYFPYQHPSVQPNLDIFLAPSSQLTIT